ncbi:VIT1/CCC1 transporter family protein [Thermoflavifilum thermophilum]|uniref:TIGR00267 family protein n=1 Tax=Thermoflavifilum thermophilum TaxID=1393122 RepID=A0A1I7NJF5_9BACT|nr:VIT1/CCC1 transporter family protein [Thermoflavifilum thermophilum]SFV34784.1 TIGR00267 family protein [Thermoflavifilum thermophilum]
MVSQSVYRTWLKYLQDEVDAAFLYQKLAEATPASRKKESYRMLHDIENRHQAAWLNLLHEHGIKVKKIKPSLKARLMAAISKWTGVEWLSYIMLKEEGNEVKTYLQLYRQATDDNTRSIAIRLAQDSAGHASELNQILGEQAEPWHSTAGTGGMLRNVVYGFNDGLTANFGLVAGVIGAQASAHFILISGLAGLVADALSMGSSGFLAAQSEREVYTHEIEMEAEEIKLMPELEKEELAAIYQAKGMDAAAARALANEVMKHPEKALEEQVHEELGIGEQRITPFREGWVTGLSTAVGAFIPVFPFLLWQGKLAIWLSIVLSMFSHFAVGAARSFFTGRNLWRSGMEMFVVGMGVAGIGYLLGDLIIRLF